MKNREQQPVPDGVHGEEARSGERRRPPSWKEAAPPAAVSLPAVGAGSSLRMGTIAAGCALGAAAAGAGTALLLPAALARGGDEALYLAAGGGAVVLALAVAAAWTAARALSRANGRARSADLVISLVSALSPEDPANWQPARFKERPDLAAFLEAVGGDLSRVRARLGRRLGLEGELGRLEKALEDGLDAGKTESFESPAVGRLADLCGKLRERATEAERRADAAREERRRLGSGTEEALPVLQESRRWNGAVLDRLSIQEVELRRLGEEARELGRRLASGPVAAGADPAADLKEIQKELAALGEADETQDLVRAVRRLDRAAERGGRLALKAAAEISRQGGGAESLLPLLQELQDVVGDVRAAGSLLEDVTPTGTGGRLEAVGRRLEQVLAVVRNQGRLGQGGARGAESAEALAAGLESAVAALGELPAGFNEQSERLERAARLLAAASGRELPPLAEAAAPATAGGAMQIEHFNDFGGTSPQEEPRARSGFGPAAPGQPREAERPAETEAAPRRKSLFDLTARPQVDATPVEAAAREAVGEEAAAEVTAADEAAADEAAADGQAVAELPAAPEPDGGAPGSMAGLVSRGGLGRSASPGLRQLASRSGDEAEQERIHDLSEFDAVALEDDVPGSTAQGAAGLDADPERIHELSEFDAVAVD